MKKQIKMVPIAIIGVIAIGILLGCASGPKFGPPTGIQMLLNQVAGLAPLTIAGKGVMLTFEGDYWRGRVDGRDTLAGECRIDETDDGAIVTLNQSWACLDTGKRVPITGKPIAQWQKTPGPEIVLEFKKGPPATLTRRGGE